MNNLNSILLEGNLVRDPELIYTNKGTAFCRFQLASNRYYKQDEEYQKEVSFFDIVTWAKQAELCNEYLNKGRGVRVIGRLKQDRWTDEDGNNYKKVKIVADHVEFKPDYKAKIGKKEDIEEKENGMGSEEVFKEYSKKENPDIFEDVRDGGSVEENVELQEQEHEKEHEKDFDTEKKSEKKPEKKLEKKPAKEKVVV